MMSISRHPVVVDISSDKTGQSDLSDIDGVTENQEMTDTKASP